MKAIACVKHVVQVTHFLEPTEKDYSLMKSQDNMSKNKNELFEYLFAAEIGVQAPGIRAELVSIWLHGSI